MPSLVFLVIAAAAVAARVYADCYKLTQSCPGETPVEVRSGKPLDGGQPSGDQREGVQAAIDTIKGWVQSCGIEGPLDENGSPVDPGVRLQELLDGGHICEETKADAKKVGATASNPATGTGQDSSGCNWDTSGHPGININGPYFPTQDANGNFDGKMVTDLAGTLLHELTHLYDSDGAGSREDYELTAYQKAINELCKVTGCAGVSQDVKDDVCAFISSQNQGLCNLKLGSEQVACTNCPDDGKVACPQTPPWPSPFLYPETDEFYWNLDLRGRITLDVQAQLITLSLRDGSGSWQGTFDCATPGLDFVAVTFTRVGPSTLFVGGLDSVTGYGKIVRVVFDPFTGTIHRAFVDLSSSELVVVSSMCELPGGSKIAVLDHVADAVFVYDTRARSLTKIADTGGDPDLASMTDLQAWPIPGVPIPVDPSDPLPKDGLMILATRYPAGCEETPLLLGETVRMIDQNGDGVFEQIY